MFTTTKRRRSTSWKDTECSWWVRSSGSSVPGSARWDYHEIETDHMVASNRPNELADLLAMIGDRRIN